MAVNTGIEIQWDFNAEETLTVERDTSGAFGSPTTVVEGVYGPSYDMVDGVPINGTTYYYRAKVSRGGFADSSYSGTISAVPVVLT